MARVQDRPHTVQIVLSVLAVLASAGAFEFIHNRAAKEFPVQVLISGSSTPIQGAEVSLGSIQVRPEHTDFRGDVFFTLPSNVVGEPGVISITAACWPYQD